MWVREVRPIGLQVPQEIADRCLNALGAAVAARQARELLEHCGQATPFGQVQGAADELVDLLAYRTSTQLVAHSAAKGLQPHEQVEVAELENPPPLLGDLLHSGDAVDNHRLDAAHHARRDPCQRLLPPRSAFPSRQEQRIEECGDVAAARFERRQVKNPWHSVELEPQAIGQKNKGAKRDLLRTGSGDKASKRLAEAIPVRRQLHSWPLGKELTKREALHQHPSQDGRRRAMRWPTTLSWANSPGSTALNALPATRPKPPHSSAATGRLRVFGVHARELPQFRLQPPRRNRLPKLETSTEFLYPSQFCVSPHRPRRDWRLASAC